MAAAAGLAMQPQMPRRQGVLTKWFDEKGYGFIAVDNSTDEVFMHHRVVEKGDRPTGGEKVEFSTIHDAEKGKPRADRVHILGRSPEWTPPQQGAGQFQQQHHAQAQVPQYQAPPQAQYPQGAVQMPGQQGVPSPTHQQHRAQYPVQQQQQPPAQGAYQAPPPQAQYPAPGQQANGGSVQAQVPAPGPAPAQAPVPGYPHPHMPPHMQQAPPPASGPAASPSTTPGTAPPEQQAWQQQHGAVPAPYPYPPYASGMPGYPPQMPPPAGYGYPSYPYAAPGYIPPPQGYM